MSLQFTVRRLTAPTKQELDDIASILLDAFIDSPITRAGGANDPKLMKELHRVVMAGAAVGADLFCAFDETTEEPIGCVAFYGPGKDIMSDDLQKSQGFDAFLETLPEEAMLWWQEFLPKYAALNNAIIGPRAKTDAWTFNNLAVIPAYRGKGVGRALLEAGERLAKNDGVPIIFEAREMLIVAMYQHFGYHIIAKALLRGGMGVDDFKLTILRKDFATSA